MIKNKYVFAIAICLLYIPMVFMAVNTFFPEIPDNDCYIARPFVEGDEAENIKYNEEMRECEQAYSKEESRYDGWKFIVVMIINIIAAFVMLLKLDKSVVYGLFFGVVITAFSATIRYMESRSIPGFILLVLLFGMIIYFVSSRGKK